MLGLRFCARAFSSCGKRGPLFIAVRGPLIVAEHRLQTRRLSSCGSRAQLLRGMWDLPRPGPEPASPAPAGRPSTTAPPGKPFTDFFNLSYVYMYTDTHTHSHNNISSTEHTKQVFCIFPLIGVSLVLKQFSAYWRCATNVGNIIFTWLIFKKFTSTFDFLQFCFCFLFCFFLIYLFYGCVGASFLREGFP